jgi:hypothetical protein
MPRHYVVLAGGVIFVAFAMLYLFVYGLPVDTRSRPVTFTLVSPKRENTFQVSEKIEESTSAPISRNSVVRFTLTHNGIPTVENEPIIVDSPVPSLLERYPKQVWISESILRFVRKDTSVDPMPGEVLVINETNKGISYLRIVAGDLFLVTLMDPTSTVKLEVEDVSLQRGESSYIAAKGRFGDGSEIREEGADFAVNHEYANLARYSIVIKDTGVVISSREFNRSH